jgi:glycosyltransferase involved in cell wall biosynthesis
MKITFALPAYYNFPIGGYHVHYQYANLLARKGHDVTIVFPRRLGGPDDWTARAQTFFWALRLRIHNHPLIKTFALDDAVDVRLIRNLGSDALPHADVLIATAWQTAEALADAPARCGRKFYIAYDYEHWMTADAAKRARIEETYRRNFAIVATSVVVAQTVRACGGEPVAVIPCGLDFEAFGTDNAPETRSPMRIGFPLRHEPFKGAADAIAAATRLRDRFGERLTITAFGSRAMNMPDWIRWLPSPSQKQLRAFYNAQSIFMLPSHFEGWGLPGVEAMACGAALVTTDNGGCRDYALDGQTALVVPPGVPEQMADAVARLIEDAALRLRLARAGNDFVQRYSWPEAADRLEALLRTG